MQLQNTRKFTLAGLPYLAPDPIPHIVTYRRMALQRALYREQNGADAPVDLASIQAWLDRVGAGDDVDAMIAVEAIVFRALLTPAKNSPSVAEAFPSATQAELDAIMDFFMASLPASKTSPTPSTATGLAPSQAPSSRPSRKATATRG